MPRSHPSDRATRTRAEHAGRRGETLAAWWLRGHGWRILARRAKAPGGEVDLIARRGRTLAFVEVKWRASDRARDQAIDHHRLRRVVAAANALAPRHARPGDAIRIDVILLAPGRWPRHIANAWLG